MPHSRELAIGGLRRDHLLEALRRRDVGLNEHARTLLAHAAFDEPEKRVIRVTERSVRDLGLSGGAPLSGVFAAAAAAGLAPCPLVTAPFLRLAMTDQAASSDSVMSAGRAPEGSLTVASAPVSADDEYPKGFYVRVVDGRPWLRGYRCDDEHLWSPDDRFVFAVDQPGV